MQVQTDLRVPPTRFVRRFFEKAADFLSPTLECPACDSESKQRRCERSGRVRPGKIEAAWSRAISNEIECLFPFCGASIWVPEASTYHYPMG